MAKLYEETHMAGSLSVEKSMPRGTIKSCDFGIQIAEDGRVWICIDGEAFIRFQPNRIKQPQKEV